MKKLNIKTQSKNKQREAWFLIKQGEKYLSDGCKWGAKNKALKFAKIGFALETIKQIGKGQIEKLLIPGAGLRK